MADPQQTTTPSATIPPPPTGATGWPQADNGQPDRYEYGAGTGTQRLINRLTGGGLPGVQQAIQEEHQRRLNDMENFRQQMGVLSQLMTSGKDAQGRPTHDAQGQITPEGVALQHAYEAAEKNYMDRAKISGNAKSIAENVFSFAKNLIHHHVANRGVQPTAGAAPAAAPTMQPPPSAAATPAAAAAPAATAGPPPVVPPPPSGQSKVGQNPTLASASDGATPGPAVSAPAVSSATAATAATPSPSATLPVPAPAARPAAASAPPTAATGAPTAPVLPPPPSPAAQGAAPAIPPLMQAMGAPQLATELAARNTAEADAAKMRAEIGVREKIYNDYRESHKGASPMEAMEYTRAVLGGQFPASLMRETPETVVDPAHPGQPIPAYRSAMDGQYYVPGTNTPIPGAMKWTPAIGQGKQVWGRDQNGFYSYLVDKNTNQPIAGTENRTTAPPPGYLDKIKLGHHYWADDDGNLHDMPETTVTKPVLPPPPSAPGAAAPSTSRKPAPKAGAGATAAQPSTPGGKIFGHSATAFEKSEYNADLKIVKDAEKDVDTAVDRMKTMDQNLTDGLKGNQQAMLSLVANHIGMTLGMQKGARITRAVWDEATESAPWLRRVAAHFDSDGYLSGVTLTPEQMHQMVDLGHQMVKTKQEHLQTVNDRYADVLKRRHGGEGTTALPPPPSATTSADDEIMNLVKKAKGATSGGH